LLVLAACGGQNADRPPNIVLISIDTLRADHLPAYGYPAIRTPHIDRLAADAMLFERAWSASPLTVPSHASIFTGTLPSRHGLRDNSGYRMKRTMKTLAGQLLRSGYDTAAFVSSAVLKRERGLARGFRTYDDRMDDSGLVRSGSDTVSAALEWAGQQRDGPFFLFVHIYEPHSPYEPMKGIELAYDGEIVRADAAVGSLLSALRRQNLYDDAMIVLLSDHGEGLGEHGEKEHGVLLYREALHVPLLVKLPGNSRGGRRMKANAQLLDVMPTILEQARALPSSSTLEGRSLTSLDNGASSRPIIAETTYPRVRLHWHEMNSIVRGDLHLIAAARSELFDLSTDPGEQRDLSDSRRRERHALQRELERFISSPTPPMLRVDDPSVASLGYLSGSAAEGDTPLPDPRDRISILEPMSSLMNALRAEENERALELAELILAAHPQFHEVWEKKAMALIALGREAEAREALRHSTESLSGH
jgi:arylsulfatase A-like enzyme